MTISEILGLSYSGGNRRSTTSASWSLAELNHIAEHVNETLQELVTLDNADALFGASIVINSHIVPCSIRLGSLLEQVPAGTLIAAEINGSWRVMSGEARSAIPASKGCRVSARHLQPV